MTGSFDKLSKLPPLPLFMPVGIAHDLLGSYNQVLTIAAGLPLLLAVVCLFLRTPRKIQI